MVPGISQKGEQSGSLALICPVNQELVAAHNEMVGMQSKMDKNWRGHKTCNTEKDRGNSACTFCLAREAAGSRKLKPKSKNKKGVKRAGVYV